MNARAAWKAKAAAEARVRDARGTTAYARAEEAAQEARREFTAALSRCR